MNKRVAIGAGVAAVLLLVLAAGVYSVDWSKQNSSDAPHEIPTFPTDDDDSIWADDDKTQLKHNSLAYSIFEKYGMILVPLAILMFGAMVGGVCISREEVEGE
jgi:NADH:ubiquinone oxidoreductase subunit 6 (subunit J)